MNSKKLKRKVVALNLTRILFFILFIISLIVTSLSSITGISFNYLASGDFTTIEEPISVLVLGYDWTDIPRADTIMLFSINPNNERGNVDVNVTSVPRDTEAYVTCAGTNTKINGGLNAGWDDSLSDEENIKNGSECMVETVETLFDIDIDYYVTANFDGLITLVDSVGGIEINVPYAFCEQNSDSTEDICLEAGTQILDGEEALAYARTRKAINPDKGASGDDWERNVRQQEVLLATLRELIKDPTAHATSVLKVMEEDMVTNATDILLDATGWLTGLINKTAAALASGDDIMIYVKKPEYAQEIYISPIEDLTGIPLENASELDPVEFYGEESGFAQNTHIYALSYSHLNTSTASKVYEEEVDDINFEFQMETLATGDADYTSNQVVSDTTLAYFSTSIAKTLDQEVVNDFDLYVPYDENYGIYDYYNSYNTYNSYSSSYYDSSYGY